MTTDTAGKTKAGALLLLAAGFLAAVGYVLSAPKGEEAPRDPETRVMAGVVVNDAGKPVAGADVWLTTASATDGSPLVLDQAKTDADGRFRVAVPGRWFLTNHSWRQELGLVGHKQGMRLGVVGFTRSSVPPATGTRLVLGAPSEASVQIVAPDGKPVAGASVEPRALACDMIQTDISDEYARDLAAQFKVKMRITPIGHVVRREAVPAPEALGRRLGAKTDSEGRVVLSGLARADIAAITVTSEALGRQEVRLSLYPGLAATDASVPDFPATIPLQAVGRLSGRLAAKDAGDLAGLAVRIVSQGSSPSRRGELLRLGSADVKPDADGRFEVPALAQGRLYFLVHHPKDAAVRAQPPNGALQIRAGEEATVEIPVRKAVRLHGVVRERGTGKPLAGVRLLIGQGDRNPLETVETGAAGRYSCLVAPGTVYRVPEAPRGFLPLAREEERSLVVQVPAEKAEHEAPVIELSRSLPVRGKVVGEDGSPVVGATVSAVWLGANHQFGSDRWLNDKTLTTGEGGEFRLDDLEPKAEVRLKARRKDAVTEKVAVVRPDADKVVTLRISTSAALALAGRVRDAAGRPVSGATIEVWARPWMPPPNEGTPRRVTFDTGVKTDEQGRFETPRRLEPDGEYRVVVTADGFESEQSGWVPAGEARPLVLPDVVLQRVRAVEGRVRDRQGKPVAGARVLYVDERKRVGATSDSEGRFRLEGVLDAPGFLFVEKAGFRFTGRASGPGADGGDVVLLHTDEPGERAMKALPDALPRNERRALAARVLQQAPARGDEGTRLRALESLARIDPARVLEQLDKGTVKGEWNQDYLRRAVAKRLAEDSLDEARTVIDAMRTPDFRSMGYCDLCDALPAAEKKQKLAFLGDALLHARAIEDASHRLVHTTAVAKRLRDLGETQRADKLLRDGEAMARELPKAGWATYARGNFAAELAVIDLPAALPLIKDLKDTFEYDRHHGNIAHKIAGANPAEAERVLGMMGKRGEGMREQWAVRVCYRMAPADLERARRIAEAMGDPYQRAYAYGVMAEALAKVRPAAATDLLHRAFGILEGQVQGGKDRFNNFHSAPVVGAALLPAAEQIDARLVPEFFWRVLSLRGPRPREGTEALLADGGDAALALLLARYDRTTAKRLLEPLIPRAATLLNSGHARALMPALVVVDPKRAAEVFEGLPAGRVKEAERSSVAKTLMLEGTERRRDAHSQVSLWLPDEEDW